MAVTFDNSQIKKGLNKLDNMIPDYISKAVNNVANEILRLSTFEVPHDTGMLQTSGHVESASKSESVVGFNKVYAAKLHEHPEYRFQKGRKGKYLEDPIKNNLSIFNNYFGKAMKGLFR